MPARSPPGQNIKKILQKVIIPEIVERVTIRKLQRKPKETLLIV